MKQIRKRLTYANVMSSIAVFLVLGGATAVAASKIGASEIKANSIKTGKIVKEAVTAGKIKNGAITSSKLGPAAITAAAVADNAVTTSKLADGAVTSPKLGNNAVTTTKLADGAVSGPKLGKETVSNEKLTGNAVSTPKIANGAVTPEKLSQDYLPAATPGVPVAGASIAADGTVNKFFNRLGGAPTVTKAGTGDYRVTFPGLEGQLYYNNSIVLLSLREGPGEIARTSFSGNAGIDTYNSSGTAADREFNMVVFLTGGEP